jgi:hypothetical protein
VTANVITRVDTDSLVAAIAGGSAAEAESKVTGLTLEDRLRIIYELSKHVYVDTPKRNVNLLNKIHQYSEVTK